MAKNLILGLILAQILSQKIFSWDLPRLDVIHCCKLSLHAISRKTNELNLRKWQKISFGPDFGPNLDSQFFFVDFTST